MPRSNRVGVAGGPNTRVRLNNDMDISNLTPAQIEEARAIAAAAMEQERAQAEAARLALLAPVTGLVNSPSFRRVYADLAALRSTYSDNGNFSVHLNALHEIMPRLAQAANIGTIGSPDPEEAGDDE